MKAQLRRLEPEVCSGAARWPHRLVDSPRAPSCDARAICFKGEQEVGNNRRPFALRTGFRQAVVRSLAAFKAQGGSDGSVIGAIVQGAAPLGAIAQATASTISSQACLALLGKALQGRNRFAGRKSRPFDVIKGFCRVAAQWPDLIWATDGQAPMTPYKEFISGRAKPFPVPTGHVIKVDGRFIKATKANGHVIKANGRFIKANGRFIKADGRFIRGSFDALQGQVRVWDLGFRVIEYCFAYSVPAGTVPREGRPLGQLHSCWRFIGNSLDLLPGR